MIDLLHPDWPAPSNVRALVTTRSGAVRGEHGQSAVQDFNLSEQGGADPAAVRRNLELLDNILGTDHPASWVRQVHGTRVITRGASVNPEIAEADAWYLRERQRPCAILTADCLPVFLSDSAGREVALAHAGWRGLAGGVIENTLAHFESAPGNILAWLGPAIGPCHFEVGDEVREQFTMSSASPARTAIAAAFKAGAAPGKWMADLYALARIRLQLAGVDQVYGGGLCTYCDDSRFYSYRRNKTTGRFASIIWLD